MKYLTFKHLFLSVLLSLLSILSYGQTPCSNLFFSEYAESGPTKVLEIYNASASSISLADYEIHLFFNGNTTATTIQLGNKTLTPYGTFVISDLSPGPEVIAKADTTTGSMSFTGNDAIALINVTLGDTVDIIGVIGQDPGTSWDGGGLGTEDIVLRRKFSIQFGVTSNPVSFDPSVEWEAGDSINDYVNIGIHNSSCSPLVNCTELFFSEYVEEGSNKALEIYNSSSSTVTMSDYEVHRFQNGSNVANGIVAFNGKQVAPGQTYVVASSIASAALINLSDTISPEISFNGNDAMALINVSTGDTLDIIGKIDEDPGIAWSNNGISTEDMILRRKFNIGKGLSSNPAVFDPSIEWDTAASNTDYSNIGVHSSACHDCYERDDTTSLVRCYTAAPAEWRSNFYFEPGYYFDTVTGVSCDTIFTLYLDTLDSDSLIAATFKTSQFTVCGNDSLLVEASFSDTTSVIFYWIINGVTYENTGQDSSVYIHYDDINDGDSLFIEVSNITGCYNPTSAFSDTIFLTKSSLPKPVITRVEDTLIIAQNGTIFSWYKDSTVIPGNDTNTLVINPNDSACYYVEVLDSTGDCIQTSELFCIGCLFVADTIYDSICLLTQTYDFRGQTISDTGTYRDTVTGGVCDTIFTLILDSVAYKATPIISFDQGLVQDVCHGDHLELSVSTTNHEFDVEYFWIINGVEYANTGGDSTLIIPADSLEDGDEIYVEADYSNECVVDPSSLSDTIIINKPNFNKPVITRLVDTLMVANNAGAYAWYKDSVLLPGNDTNVLVINPNDTACYYVEALDSTAVCLLISDEFCTFPQTPDTAGCTELFISEYTEGTGTNKAIEIYNPTTDTIDLTSYSIEIFANGGVTPNNTIPLTGSLNPYKVHVLVNNTAEVKFTSKADQLSAALSFNGNDAILLLKGTDTVDVFGEIGNDPGPTGWEGLTADMTWIRKSTIREGLKSNPNAFDPFEDWVFTSVNDTANLGTHTSDCNDSICETFRDTIYANVCINDSVEYRGKWYHSAGFYSDTVTTASCDSIYSIDVAIIPPLNAEIVSQDDTLLLVDFGLAKEWYKDGVLVSTNDSLVISPNDFACYTAVVEDVPLGCLQETAPYCIFDSTDCAELFFSTYIEGPTGFANDKALEIYNPTSVPIDLTSYSVSLYVNGAPNVSSSLDLQGTIAPYDVFVISKSNADSVLLTKADTVSGIMNHTGNDVLALFKDTVQIDIIGSIGTDSVWTENGVSTSDQLLVRKPFVKKGLKNNPYPFDPSLEWETRPAQDYFEFDGHVSDCQQDCEVYDTTYRLICAGDSVEFYGDFYHLNGTYTVVDSSQACDSVHTLELNLIVPANRDIEVVNDSILVVNDAVVLEWFREGVSWSMADSLIVDLDDTACFYAEVLDDLTGCPTVSETYCLNECTIYADTIYDTICENDIYSFRDEVVFTQGFHYDTSSLGTCDTVFTLHLEFYQVTLPTVVANAGGDTLTVSSGDVIAWRDEDGNILGDTSFLVIDPSDTLCLFASVTDPIHGCLNYTPDYCINECTIYADTIYDTICDSELYDFRGEGVFTQGFHYDTSTLGLCDTVFTLSLQFYQTITPTVVANGDTLTVSEGEVIRWLDLDGNQYLVDTLILAPGDTGCYFASVTDTANGCILITNDYCIQDTVCYAQGDTLVDTICSNDFYAFGSQILTMAGTYVDTVEHSNGCDTIITLFLETKNCTDTSDCGELFISEYVEGTGFNKAIEIYNPTSGTIDLSTYSIALFNNGDTTATATYPLTGSLASYDVFVITRGTSDPGFLNRSDMTAGFTYNGDDAVVLYNGSTIVDIFGKIGDLPGSNGWGTGTKDMTWVRKAHVSKGVRVNPVTFDPADDWFSTSVDDSTQLGFHNSNCADCYVVADTTYGYFCPNDTSFSGYTTWRGENYSAEGTFFDTVSGSSCDTIFTLINEQEVPLINPSIIANNDTLTISEGILDAWYKDGVLVSLDDTLFINTNDTSCYTAEVEDNATGCLVTTTDYCVGCTPYLDTTYDTICANDSTFFRGAWYDAAGTYTDVVPGSTACDSTFVLVLNNYPVTQPQIVVTSDTILSVDYGQVFGWYNTNDPLTVISVNQTLTISSNDTSCYDAYVLDTVTGCSIFSDEYCAGCQSLYDTIQQEICNGDSILFNGVYRSVTGLYVDTTAGQNGCDNYLFMDLVVSAAPVTNIYDTICTGDSLLFQGFYLKDPGMYQETFPYSPSCDSTVILHLAVSNGIASNIAITVNTTNTCSANPNNFSISNINGEGANPMIQWYVNGAVVTSGNTFTSPAGSLNSGDSIQALLIPDLSCALEDSVYSNYIIMSGAVSTNDTTKDTICQGDSYTWGNSTYTTAGTYFDTVPNPNGCDSIRVLELFSHPIPIVVANIGPGEDTIPINGTVNFDPNGSNASNYEWDFGDGNTSTLNTVSHTYTAPGVYTAILRGDLLFGCSAYDTVIIVVQGNIGLEELSNNNNVSVYPNPVSDVLTIAFNGDQSVIEEVQILDAKGNAVYSNTFASKAKLATVDLSGYERGVYFVRIKGDQLNKHVRVIKIN